MKIYNFSGFESGNIFEALHTGFTTAPANCTIQSTTKRTGNYALRCHNTTGTDKAFYALRNNTNGLEYSFWTPNGTNSNNAGVYTKFYFQYLTKPASDFETFFALDIIPSPGVDVVLSSTGTIDISSGYAYTAGSTILSSGVWYRLDIYYDTNGNLSLEINGVDEHTNIVVNPTNSPIAHIYFGKADNSFGQVVDYYYDDIIVTDSDAYEGDTKVGLLHPTGAGNFSQWTGSYTDVNSVPPNTSTYIRDLSGTAAVIESFAIQPYTSLPVFTQILGLKVLAVVTCGSSTRNDFYALLDYNHQASTKDLEIVYNVSFDDNRAYKESGIYVKNIYNNNLWQASDINSTYIGVGTSGLDTNPDNLACCANYLMVVMTADYFGSGGVLIEDTSFVELITSPGSSGKVLISGLALFITTLLGSGKVLIGSSSKIVTSYSIFSTNGVKISGAASLLVLHNLSISGKAVISGIAHIPTTYDIISNGQKIVISGQAHFPITLSVGGKVNISGVAGFFDVYNTSSSGQVKISGVVIFNAVKSLTGFGKAIINGSASLKVIYKQTTSGEVKISGHAPINYPIAISGSVNISGSVIVSHKITYVASSGVIISGSVKSPDKYNEIANGKVNVNGIAKISHIPDVSVGGKILLSGHGWSFFYNTGSGIVLISGIASTSSYLGIGGKVIIFGSAVVNVISTTGFECIFDGTEEAVKVEFYHPEVISKRRNKKKLDDREGAFLSAITVCELLREGRISEFN